MSDNKEKLELIKKKDKDYLFELQKFLDIVSNINDEDLKQRIVNQMSNCNKRLVEIMEKIINDGE